MRTRGTFSSVLVGLALLSAGLPLGTAAADATPALVAPPGGDAVVVAVIDDGLSPYHWDYLAAKMPQALDTDPSNDLPLTQDPATWLQGFPQSGFASSTALDLHLDDQNASTDLETLKAQDAQEWAHVQTSSPTDIHYYWVPGTKVIGGLSFGAPGPGTFYGIAHGQGASSVAVGNLHGTCPECLVVHITASDDAASAQALEWAESQPWIDVISNSYGLQTLPVYYLRDNVYGGPVEPQRTASERGQTIVFSSGNGIDNAFYVPNNTLLSSLKGPDWVITVGGTNPDDAGSNPIGTGKPVDVAGIVDAYPSAYGSSTVSNGGGFNGTSNAAPTVAGTYARGLWTARRVMAGPSRTQSAGVVSVGAAACGSARPSCEVGDGSLTAVELRHRLLLGAVSTGGGTSLTGSPLTPVLPPVGDAHYAGEGHGTYKARLNGDAAWLAEFDTFAGPLLGTRAPLARPADEAAWFVVDSWCRQHIWGAWNGGYYKAGDALPLPDPLAPVRDAYQVACNAIVAPPAPPGA